MAPSAEIITQINDQDIICGRNGVALRHPGNIAYRRMVSLNRDLYATSLRSEKVRISKGIVSAMREAGGRFLEREDGKTGLSLEERDVSWRDIGDKRAFEKTSQALREGQPKRLERLAEGPRRAAAPSPARPDRFHGRRTAVETPNQRTAVEAPIGATYGDAVRLHHDVAALSRTHHYHPLAVEPLVPIYSHTYRPHLYQAVPTTLALPPSLAPLPSYGNSEYLLLVDLLTAVDAHYGQQFISLRDENS